MMNEEASALGKILGEQMGKVHGAIIYLTRVLVAQKAIGPGHARRVFRTLNGPVKDSAAADLYGELVREVVALNRNRPNRPLARIRAARDRR